MITTMAKVFITKYALTEGIKEIEAKHMCMQMRGVEKQNSVTTTSDFTGDFKSCS